MVLSTVGGSPSQGSVAVDLRYPNANSRILQALSYLNFFQSHALLSREEHSLILRHCYYEIKKIRPGMR
jgi:hypothetical protein